MTTEPKGRVTFRISAALFALAVVSELLGLKNEVPLFGVLVEGAAGVAYHVVYAALFALLAFGLWVGHRVGYYTLFLTTVIYTVDRIQVVLAPEALVAMLNRYPAGGEVLRIVGRDSLMQGMTIMAVTVVVCWWGFAVYAYYRRSYFGIVSAGS